MSSADLLRQRLEDNGFNVASQSSIVADNEQDKILQSIRQKYKKTK